MYSQFAFIVTASTRGEKCRILQKEFPYNRPIFNEFAVGISIMRDFHAIDQSKCGGLDSGIPSRSTQIVRLADVDHKMRTRTDQQDVAKSS
jgi:hypothetical protein